MVVLHINSVYCVQILQKSVDICRNCSHMKKVGVQCICPTEQTDRQTDRKTPDRCIIHSPLYRPDDGRPSIAYGPWTVVAATIGTAAAAVSYALNYAYAIMHALPLSV